MLKNTEQIKKYKELLRILQEMAEEDYQWIPPLAKKIRENADILGKFLSKTLFDVIRNPSYDFFKTAHLNLIKDLARGFAPKSSVYIDNLESLLRKSGCILGKKSGSFLGDQSVITQTTIQSLKTFCLVLENSPQLILIFKKPKLFEEFFGELGIELSSYLQIFPIFSKSALKSFPFLKESFYRSLHQLDPVERQSLFDMMESLLRITFEEKITPLLHQKLQDDPRKHILVPIFAGAMDAISGENALNICINIICTKQSEFTIGRILFLVIQEIGGLYLKITQVLSELCPPNLAKELRHSQDDAGGLFPSQEKSFRYLLKSLNKKEMGEWRNAFQLPRKPFPHFASASVGALYQLELTPEKQQELGVTSVLVKLQRPNLKELFQKQFTLLTNLISQTENAVASAVSFSTETRFELQGLLATLQRSVLNYYKQSASELDFRSEKYNADRVREALGDHSNVRVPQYYFTSPTMAIMECMSGSKVTKIVQKKYLERVKIADKMADTYLNLLFQKGVVWADPHAGNILYDDKNHILTMIDLNPSYIWDQEVRNQFCHLIYALLLRDKEKSFKTLIYLVEDPHKIHAENLKKSLHKFLQEEIIGTKLTNFVGEFIKTLGENKINLKIEVQAALRGLSQIALTSASISARNHFGSLLSKHLDRRDFVRSLLSTGIFRVLKIAILTVSDLLKHIPESDIGPVIDERDVRELQKRFHQIDRANVCRIQLKRISPDDSAYLTISRDGQKLLISSALFIEILEKNKPVRVKYVLHIPSKEWLSERQEFVKISGIAKNLCIIESLEQLRRVSLDDYWKIIEGWNKPRNARTLEEIELIRSLRVASMRLFSLRFSSLWDISALGLGLYYRIAWKVLLKTELYKEKLKQQVFYLSALEAQKTKIGIFAASSHIFLVIFHIIYLFIVSLVQKQRFYMKLTPISSEDLVDLLLFGLYRRKHTSTK